jgi:hypothetical protein
MSSPYNPVRNGGASKMNARLNCVSEITIPAT